jgi:GntR family transcriptional regulator/MocR family aminotransferase
MRTYDLTGTGSDSLYQTLYKQIRSDILQGNLKPGEKLPSKRALAANLGISVITVENAYAQLISEGYLYALPKRGFYVSDFKAHVTAPVRVSPQKSARPSEKSPRYLADFSSNQTESELFPFTLWSRVIRDLLSDSRVQLMTNSPCGGIAELRQRIAGHLRDFRGMNVRPEQIIIGAGTEYLYGLLIQLLGRDKIYAIENPGYRKLADIYQSCGARCEWIDMDESGVCVSSLEQHQADILHITPSHQYPTGIVMPISRRYELMGWAAKAPGRFIIEDDYDSELRLSGQPIPTLQSIDLSGRVIYMNTFTKTLCSTVRISYMVLPDGLLDAFYQKLSFYSCTVSNFEQYTLARFIETGKFEAHLNRLRSHYRKKRDALLAAFMRSPLVEHIELSGEEAGLHFLMSLRTPLEQQTVMERAQARGIRLLPLSRYYFGQPPVQNVYIMNYSSLDVQLADEIAARLYESAFMSK